MPEKINWTLNVQVVGGPQIPHSQTDEVEIYVKGNIALNKGSKKEIPIVSGNQAPVDFLLLKPDQAGAALSYSVNDDKPDLKDRFKLDALQLVIGEASKRLLGTDSPTKLFFYNDWDKATSIQILVGRKVKTALTGGGTTGGTSPSGVSPGATSSPPRKRSR